MSMNWSKARKYKGCEPIDGVQQPYSSQYFSKLKAKAIQITRERGVNNFSKFGPKNPINYQLTPKAHNETGTRPISELDVGAITAGKEGLTQTRKVIKPKTDSIEVCGSVITPDNKVSITEYNGIMRISSTPKSKPTT